MYGAFVKLLNMSAASAILIGVVLVLRMVFRKLPKKYLCVLWLFVALRLCCPFMLSSSLSVFNHIGAYHNGQLEYVRYNEKTEKPILEIPAALLKSAGDGPTVTFSAAKLYLPTVMTLWSIGAALMLLYAAVSFLHIQRRTRERILYRGNIYLCDHVPSPFVLGLVKPKIYLPSDIAEEQINCVIAHERTHLRRGDHWWKSLGFLLLSIHWFNPMVWVGYLFFCRDMELVCDEAVISALDAAQKQTYSRALLACSMPRGFITACPLAFGEIGVKQRIKSILNYRKPAKYAFGAALAICLVLAAVFLTNPVRVGDYMKVTSYESNTFGEQGASIQLHTGTFVQNVTIHAELWENGTCTQSIPLTLPADTKKVQLTLIHELGNAGTTTLRSSILAVTSPGEESHGALIVLPEQSYLLDSLDWQGDKTIDLSKDTKVLLSAMLFDHGDGGFFLFTFDNKDFGDCAYRLQEQECAVLVWLSAE